jgi:hypothetical protein
MKFHFQSIDEEKLIKESFLKFSYSLIGEPGEKRNVRFRIFDPFFNVQYTPGSHDVSVETNVNYWVGFSVSPNENLEKPNLKFGFRIIADDIDSYEILYNEIHETHRVAYEMRGDAPDKTKRAWIIGDSHAWDSFIGPGNSRPPMLVDYYPVRVSTMSFSLNRFVSGRYIDFMDKLPISSNDCIILYLGEIDFRYTIHKHCSRKGTKVSDECLSLMERYQHALTEICNRYPNRIIVMAPNPPMRDGYLSDLLLGNEEDRILCWKIFNDFWIENLKNNNRMEYLDWTAEYTKPDGMIDTSMLLEGDHHLKNTEDIINSLACKLSGIKEIKLEDIFNNEKKEELKKFISEHKKNKNN